MQVKSRYCSFLLCLLIALSAFAQNEQPVSIAIIADKASELDKSPLVSLLEVELSQIDGIQLLERAAIDTILEEQKLSAMGLLDRNTTIQIGQLLRADAFIILSLEGQTQDSNDLIRVRVSETAHGLKLLDFFEQSVSSDLQKTIESLISKIESVLNKVNQSDEKLIPVGIVDIHRVQLGEQYKMLERTLPTMLSVRLSLEPQIVMLEREDLKVLLDEKLMTEGEDTEFWSSAILIDGYIQPNNGQLEMHLNLKQAGGENFESIIVPVEPNEPVGAIAQVTTEIIQQLQNSPPAAKWQPEQEAEQFYKQGQMLANHLRYKEAISLFETAHALQPENIYYIGEVFTNEWYLRYKIGLHAYHFGHRYGSYYSDYELALLVSDLVRQIQAGYEQKILSYSDMRNAAWDMNLGGTSFHSGYFTHIDSVITEKIKDINHENRKIWAETLGQFLKEQPDKYTGYYSNIAKMAWLGNDNPEGLLVDLNRVYKEFMLSPEYGGTISSADFRCFVCGDVIDILVKRNLHNRMKKILPKITKYNQDQLIGILETIYNPLIDVNDVKTLGIWTPIYPLNIDYFNLSEKAAKQYYELLGKAAKFLQTHAYSSGVKIWLGHFRDCQAKISLKYPQLNLQSEQPDIKTTMLFKQEEFLPRSTVIKWPLKPFFEKDRLWVAAGFWPLGRLNSEGIREWKGNFIIESIDLTQKSVAAKWQGEIILNDSAYVTGLQVTDNKIYVAIYGGGLLEFNRVHNNERESIEISRNLTIKQGLPSNLITDILVEGQKLWVAYGGNGRESGLGIYEPEKERWTNILCSTTNQETSFISGKSYIISELTKTLPNKLLFTVADSPSSSTRQKEGLWGIDTETYDLNCFIQYDSRWADPPIYLEMIDGDCFYKIDSMLVKVEPKTENISLVLISQSFATAEARPIYLSVGLDNLFASPSKQTQILIGIYENNCLDLSTCTIHNNKLWARYGKSQVGIIQLGKPINEARIILNNLLDGQKVERFIHTPHGLVGIGNGIVGLIETENIGK